MQCDLTQERDILEVFQWIKEHVGGVDILVNNAGRSGEATLTASDTAEWRDLVDVNVLGLSICTREAIQQMRARRVQDGHIVHIGSIGGHMNPINPGLSVYSATKHAVRVMTEGLRRELVANNSGIRVTEVSPGLVKTELAGRLKTRNLDEWWKHPYLQPEDVADAVLYALSTPPHVQIHEIIVKPVGEVF